VTEGKKFVTRIPFNDYQQSYLLAKLANQELKATSIAVIRNTSQPYSDFLGKQFAIELRKMNPSIRVREFPIFEGFTAFSSLIDKVLAEPTDLIFVPVMQASIANVYVALESKKAELTLLSSDTIEGQPKFIDLLGARSGRIRFIYPKHWNDKVEGPESVNYLHLHKKYCAKYPHSMTTVAAYDAASILVRSVKQNPELRGRKVIEAIHRTHFNGMAGPLVYGKQNDPIKPLELFELRGNRGVHWRRWE
jgi:ABC-type branched-subunit amino acid transport system substrate-binding protein